MSRIEEIRKRLEDSKHVYFSASEEEVSYLLSQLDIAVKALDDLSNKDNWKKFNGSILWYGDINKPLAHDLAIEALEKLRG